MEVTQTHHLQSETELAEAVLTLRHAMNRATAGRFIIAPDPKQEAIHCYVADSPYSRLVFSAAWEAAQNYEAAMKAKEQQQEQEAAQ